MKGDQAGRADTYAINNHYAYFKIARSSLAEAVRPQEDYQRWESQQPEKITTAAELTARVDWMGKRENRCIISVVFSALAIEAYINSYATMNMSKSLLRTIMISLTLQQSGSSYQRWLRGERSILAQPLSNHCEGSSRLGTDSCIQKLRLSHLIQRKQTG
jgi:hypothetical protein